MAGVRRVGVRAAGFQGGCGTVSSGKGSGVAGGPFGSGSCVVEVAPPEDVAGLSLLVLGVGVTSVDKLRFSSLGLHKLDGGVCRGYWCRSRV